MRGTLRMRGKKCNFIGRPHYKAIETGAGEFLSELRRNPAGRLVNNTGPGGMAAHWREHEEGRVRRADRRELAL